MAEVLVNFDSEFKGPDGRFYQARACGRERPDGMWDGWLEFTALSDGTVTETARETTQPGRYVCKTELSSGCPPGDPRTSREAVRGCTPNSDPRSGHPVIAVFTIKGKG